MIELDEVSQRLILTLVQVFQDPKQASFWLADGRGLDSLHLGIFAGLLPPEALDQPRKYRAEVRGIINRLEHLKTLALVAPVDGRPLYDGARPTEAGVAHVIQIRKPWWRALLSRFA